MRKFLARSGMYIALLFSWIDTCYAVDTYRYVHVSIDSVWTIFLFLLAFVLAPIVLMGALVWYSARRKKNLKKEQSVVAESEK